MSDQPTYNIIPSRLPAHMQPLAEEICTYFRELPRLLEEGCEGKFALIHGNDLVNLWDTYDDALQAGYDRFGFEKFMAQPVNVVDRDGLAGFFLVQPERASA